MWDQGKRDQYHSWLIDLQEKRYVSDWQRIEKLRNIQDQLVRIPGTAKNIDIFDGLEKEVLSKFSSRQEAKKYIAYHWATRSTPDHLELFDLPDNGIMKVVDKWVVVLENQLVKYKNPAT
jgi:hypothetical protein